jgi:hypothetical protein
MRRANAARQNAERFISPVRVMLEKALAAIEDNAPVEVTPKSSRLRKKLLGETNRKREDRKKEAAVVRRLLLAHDLFRKPVPAFRDHALACRRKPQIRRPGFGRSLIRIGKNRIT